MVNTKFNKKYLVLLIVLISSALFLFGCTQTNYCGDNFCAGSETSSTCPSDCSLNPLNEGNSVNTAGKPAASATIPECIDSDSGKTYATVGYVGGICADCTPPGTVGGNSDSCVTQESDGKLNIAPNSTQLMEFYCTGSGWAREVIDCPNGCTEGKCN